MSYNSFKNDWNDIIRDELFPDVQLKKMMRIPQGTRILDFIEKYFIRAGYTNETLTSEDVRVVYKMFAVGQQNEKVTRNQISIDIYVKREHLHNYGKDRLESRAQLIAGKLYQILTKERYFHNYRFWIAGQGDMGTSAIGYVRYNITLNYMKVY